MEFSQESPEFFHMKKHELRIKSNVNCNIYIDTEYTCSAEANRFAKILLDAGDYMVKVENAAYPDDCLDTEVSLDKDQLIKATLRELSDTDSKNEAPVVVPVSKDKRVRDDSRCQKPSTASQISEIVESLAKSKVEDKSQIPNNTFKDDSKALGEPHSLSGASSKGTLDSITKGAPTEKNGNTSSSVNWAKTGKYILIIALVIVIVLIADAIGIKLPTWFFMLFKYL
jgi:hypothetical protein